MNAAGRVAVVTDSTAYLPGTMAADHGIEVVPVTVVIAGQDYDEGVDVTPHQVAEALHAWSPVSTSRPAPQRMLETYRRLADEGAAAVLSIHLSRDMSGTYESALLAGREAPIPVAAVDSRSIAMAMGFGVVDAAIAAAAGADLDESRAVAEKRIARASMFFYVDTLEYLRRGGRIGGAAKLVGSALAVKPLLHLSDGRVAPLEKVRTSAKALARLEELAVERSVPGSTDIAVQHLEAGDRAESLAATLRARLPGASVVVSEVGAAVGAHVGPGMVAVVVSPR